MRRLTAALTIVIIIGLALSLLWRVYEHHQASLPYSHESEVTAPNAPAA